MRAFSLRPKISRDKSKPSGSSNTEVQALLERAGCDIDVPESELGVQNGHAVVPEMLRTEVLVKFLLYSYLRAPVDGAEEELEPMGAPRLLDVEAGVEEESSTCCCAPAGASGERSCAVTWRPDNWPGEASAEAD
ncbi:unnamed protein product [Polarella glacialis]|uniref:Uncharacterized protein n=1 Tax=Polarella glacialis TaxID=89957 RepID=A0A813GUC9_POLGL|nr:unnamed protein product [Polarella glacialis]